MKAVLSGSLEAVFWMINKILKLAPIGVFAFICTTIMTFGASALIPLLKLLLVVIGAMIFFIIVVLGIVARLCGISIFSIIKILKNELVLAFSTSSSESVLPIIMKKMENFGSPKDITSFVVPIGYTFNLDGSALYQSIAALFVAQMYGIDMSIGQQIMLMVTLMVASKGMAGVPGVSIVVLITTLTTMGLPAEGLALIIGVDRLLDMVRTCVNVLGNALSTIVIAKWENAYDKEKGQAYLKSI